MTPISAIAMVGIAPMEAGAASGLFNIMRNLGGAIGTAAVETFFTKREQFHSAIINACGGAAPRHHRRRPNDHRFDARTRGTSPVRYQRTPGSVRGAAGNSRSYRDLAARKDDATQQRDSRKGTYGIIDGVAISPP
jgi:hypothetical protein